MASPYTFCIPYLTLCSCCVAAMPALYNRAFYSGRSFCRVCYHTAPHTPLPYLTPPTISLFGLSICCWCYWTEVPGGEEGQHAFLVARCRYWRSRVLPLRRCLRTFCCRTCILRACVPTPFPVLCMGRLFFRRKQWFSLNLLLLLRDVHRYAASSWRCNARNSPVRLRFFFRIPFVGCGFSEYNGINAAGILFIDAPYSEVRLCLWFCTVLVCYPSSLGLDMDGARVQAGLRLWRDGYVRG